MLGGFGSGKTSGAAMCGIVRALEDSWTPEYEDDHPTSVVIGLTAKVIKDSSYRALKSLLPRELVRREWVSSQDWRILLDSGHQIIFRTWSGEIEGLNASGFVWIDEAHLLDDPLAFTNFVGRARDPRAKQTPLILVSGIPVFGWLREYFGPDGQFPDARVVHASTYDNHYLSTDVVERIRASCSQRDAETYLAGRWQTPEHAVYHEYDPLVHNIQTPGDRAQWCHVSIDPGERAAVLWIQPRGDGWHVVDELTPTQQPVSAIAAQIKARGWRLEPGNSRIYMDPTTGRDQLNAVERVFPGIPVIRKSSKSDRTRSVEYGIRCVNAALRDEQGRVRLTFWAGLPREPRSLLTAVAKLQRHPKTGLPVKDNTTDHIGLDCLRYPIADLVPLYDSGISVY